MIEDFSLVVQLELCITMLLVLLHHLVQMAIEEAVVVGVCSCYHIVASFLVTYIWSSQVHGMKWNDTEEDMAAVCSLFFC